MKKLSLISCFLIIFSILSLGCTSKEDKADLDAKAVEDNAITLNVTSTSDTDIIAANYYGEKYQISNNKLNIEDNKGDSLSWNELKDAKVIEVHYSDGIKEVSPGIFKKITKIVVMS